MNEVKDGKELFSFSPREITDRARIEEIIDSVTVKETSKDGMACLALVHKGKLTTVGGKLLKRLALKVTEFPLIRIKHECKYIEEHRKLLTYTSRLKEDFEQGAFYPVECADRKKFIDGRWTDAFIKLKENKNGEIASTCKIIDCPKCNGSGKVDGTSTSRVDVRKNCPLCKGTGLEGIHKCWRCSGRGWVVEEEKRHEHTLYECPKCKGDKKLKQILVAEHDGPQKMDLEWWIVVENESNLFPSQITFSWDSSLKDDFHKKLVKFKLLKKIENKGAIDPKLNDLSDLSLTPNARKRIFDFVFTDHSEWRLDAAREKIRKESYYVKLKRGDGPNCYCFGACGHTLENCQDKKVRYVCEEENVRVFSAVGLVKIDFEYKIGGYASTHKKSIWVNLITQRILNLRYIPHYDDFDHIFTGGGSLGDEDVKRLVRENLQEEEVSSVEKCLKKSNSKKQKGTTKERKDTAQGCGCLLAIIALVAFGIWWWIEGFSMSAITDLWKSANKDGSLGTAVMVLGGLAATFIGGKLLKKNDSGESTSPKKRWKFITLGILFGFLGAHLAYAKRWVLFLLLWAGLICGNVMNEKKTTEGAPDVPPAVQEQSQEVSPEGGAQESEKKSSNPISNAGFAVWGLLWIGGTLFIKKDGNGCRM